MRYGRTESPHDLDNPWDQHRILDIEHYVDDDDSLDIIHHQHLDLHHHMNTPPLIISSGGAISQSTIVQLQPHDICTCNAPLQDHHHSSIDDDRIPQCCLLESTTSRTSNGAQL